MSLEMNITVRWITVPILAVVVAILETITRSDLAYGIAILFEGVFMTALVFLCFLPFFNIFLLVYSKEFIADQFALWGMSGGLGSAIVFAYAFMLMFLVSLFIDFFFGRAIIAYFGGNKRPMAVAMLYLRELLIGR